MVVTYALPNLFRRNPDTFFSIRAQLGGIIGFVFRPFLMVFFSIHLNSFFIEGLDCRRILS